MTSSYKGQIYYRLDALYFYSSRAGGAETEETEETEDDNVEDEGETPAEDETGTFLRCLRKIPSQIA